MRYFRKGQKNKCTQCMLEKKKTDYFRKAWILKMLFPGANSDQGQLF